MKNKIRVDSVDPVGEIAEDSVDELHDMLLKNIMKQIKINSDNDDKFFNKELSEISNIGEMDVGSADFKKLMKLHEFNKNSTLKTISYLKELTDLNEVGTVDNSGVESFINAMRINRERVDEER